MEEYLSREEELSYYLKLKKEKWKTEKLLKITTY